MGAATDSDPLSPGRLPTEKPPFTLAEIKRSIPPRCFHRSLARSSAYLLRDVAAAGALQLLLGWPLYLACNAAGHPYPRFASHFDPYSPIFSGRGERLQVVLSDAGVLAVALALCRLGSLGTVARLYVAPLAVVKAWLVLVTYLQHTDPAVPRYCITEWDWLRGALATVDRDYGAFLNAAFHNIADTHVVHHLFPSLPHYHAAEATAAIRPVLREYYRFDDTPIARAAWRAARECVYVEPEGGRDGVFWYGNKF